MHVCVLGGGIVGLSTAYALQQSGHQVTLVEQAEVAAGASGGNGGQLSYSYVQPLADPSIWRQLPKLLLSPHSPLKLRLQWDLAQWAWGLGFLKACTRAQSLASTQALLHLAAQSRARLEQALAQEGDALACDFATSGKLVLLDTEPSFAAARRQMDLQRRLGGARQQALTPAEAVAIEPALAAAARRFAGAIYTPSECAADCQRLCTGLAALLQARGADLRTGRQALSLVTRSQRVLAVRLAAGRDHLTEDLAADAFVLALGADTPKLLRPLGLRVPVYPLKGYSLSLDIAEPSLAPRASITDAASKVVYARLGSRLRVAGMAELVGHDLHIPAQRATRLRDATERLFPGACASGGPLRAWAGLRPATPTGQPIVGRHPKGPHNLLLNAGHGALGLTLAFGTAWQVAQALAPQTARASPATRLGEAPSELPA